MAPSIPAELRERPQWVVWRRETRDGKLTKVPCRPEAPTERASSTDPSTWSTHADAARAASQSGVDGIGFVFTEKDPFAGIDFDRCFDEKGIDPHVAGLLQRLDSYTECSPSGNGLHVIVRATLNGGRKRTSKTPWGAEFESYDRGRFFCVTGNHLLGTPKTINERQRELDAIRAEMFPTQENVPPRVVTVPVNVDDRELLERARRAKNGAKFETLYYAREHTYPSDSEADLALCNMLAFWFVEPGRIDRAFRGSARMRPKWDQRHGESTYGEQTIAKAIEKMTDSFGSAEDKPSARVTAPHKRVPSVQSTSSTASRWPQPLPPEAFAGLAGEIVRAIEPVSEADPAVLLIAALTAFGSACGRGPGFDVGGTFHATNLFVVTVGHTSAGRKGTGWDAIKPVFARADVEWTQERVQSGLSSGEGLIHAVRDAQSKQVAVKEGGKPTGEYVEEIEDQGVEDKRLLAREGEFASVLRVMRRDGNTLSTTVRSLWDSGDVRTLTKGKPERATGAHVSIVGDITPEELRRELDDTSAANGFLNRFLIVCAKRSKSLPFGGALEPTTLDELAGVVRASLRFASTQNSIQFDAEATTLWRGKYTALTTGRSGLFGAAIGRAAPQVRRMATIFALMDMSAVVRGADLRAALAVWRYCEASARFIFGERLGDHVADRLIEALREAPEGLTRSDMRGLLGNRIPGERIDTALDLLRELGLAEDEHQRTEGRPAERWRAVEIVEKTEESPPATPLYSVSSTSSTTNNTPAQEPDLADDLLAGRITRGVFWEGVSRLPEAEQDTLRAKAKEAWA